MQNFNRPTLFMFVALVGGLAAVWITDAPGLPSGASAPPATTYVQEAPYPPGFERAHSLIPPWSINDYVQEEGYALGFEQAHSPIPPWSIHDFVLEEGYAPGFEQPHH